MSIKTHNDYYVYLHRRKSDNEVFYVGKGRRYRSTDRGGRTEWWRRIVKKHGFYVEYVEKEMSEQSALDLEVEVISFYRENNHPLCNITVGGDKPSSYIRTDAHKECVSRALSIPVLCSNGMLFDSARQAGRWLNNEKASSEIGKACKRKCLFAHGYVWRYTSDSDDISQLISEGKDAFIEWGFDKKFSRHHPRRLVCSNGNTYKSLRGASRELSLCSRQIVLSCKTGQPCKNGLIFCDMNVFSDKLIDKAPTEPDNLNSTII